MSSPTRTKVKCPVCGLELTTQGRNTFKCKICKEHHTIIGNILGETPKEESGETVQLAPPDPELVTPKTPPQKPKLKTCPDCEGDNIISLNRLLKTEDCYEDQIKELQENGLKRICLDCREVF